MDSLARGSKAIIWFAFIVQEQIDSGVELHLHVLERVIVMQISAQLITAKRRRGESEMIEGLLRIQGSKLDYLFVFMYICYFEN